jgi:hypothetical protein
VVASHCVPDFQVCHVETVASENASDVGMIVDRQHHFTLAGAHRLRQKLVLLKPKLYTVSLNLPVRRVGIEKSVLPVVAGKALGPREILNKST